MDPSNDDRTMCLSLDVQDFDTLDMISILVCVFGVCVIYWQLAPIYMLEGIWCERLDFVVLTFSEFGVKDTLRSTKLSHTHTHTHTHDNARDKIYIKR